MSKTEIRLIRNSRWVDTVPVSPIWFLEVREIIENHCCFHWLFVWCSLSGVVKIESVRDQVCMVMNVSQIPGVLFFSSELPSKSRETHCLQQIHCLVLLTGMCKTVFQNTFTENVCIVGYMNHNKFVKVPLLVVKAQAKRANSKSNMSNGFNFSNKKINILSTQFYHEQNKDSRGPLGQHWH